MSNSCEACWSCGMPLNNVEERAGGRAESKYCKYCADADGKLTATFDDVVAYCEKEIVEQQGIDAGEAKRLARAKIGALPAWREG